jgi:hypothetical protein
MWVSIDCKDITKVPVVVEWLLNMHFYDFAFQIEVHIEGHNHPNGILGQELIMEMTIHH